MLLLVNEPTLLPVLLPLAPVATAASRAVDRIAATMATYGADAAMIDAEVEQMSTRRIAPTANRSVVGIMTEFAFLVDRDRGRNSTT
ncbi:DUF6933 domain-containing protein [Dactylosporangium sp. CA-152071]|uniref:DUF6933 domain-containing protein n=1 Tax=Dactylosporangium sp. CA-152071 TaxID=3239933 RepID=UPI003D8D43F8